MWFAPRLTRRRERYDSLTQESADLNELVALASDDGELDEVAESVTTLKRELDRLQEEALFSGEYDPGDAVVSIHAGEGGTDAQDWAEMVLRMYLRWAEGRGFKTELLEASPGEEAGLKDLRMVRVSARAPGIRIAPMPETPFAPEIPHAEVTYEDVWVPEPAVLPGSGWTRWARPFRTLEDTHVHAALLAYLVKVGRRAGWDKAVLERLLAAVAAAREVCGLPWDSPAVRNRSTQGRVRVGRRPTPSGAAGGGRAGPY